MAFQCEAQTSFPTYEALIDAVRHYARNTVPPFELADTTWKERDFSAARFTCAGSSTCDFVIEAQKSVGSETWNVAKTKLVHAHWLPASAAQPISAPTWSQPPLMPPRGFGHHRWGSDPTSHVPPAWSRPATYPGPSHQRGSSHPSSMPMIDHALLAAVAAASPVRVPLPGSHGDGPPAPAIGSQWKDRDVFKAACAAHGAACRPSFGFTTIGSNNTGSRPFLIYACRHFGSRQDLQCPYFIRINGPPASKPDEPWVVVDGCYRHEKHRPVSPPPRKGAWTVRERPLTRGPRKPKDPNAVGPDRRHKKTPSNSSSDTSIRRFAGHPYDYDMPEPLPRHESPKLIVDPSMPLPAFLAQLHPLLGLPGVADLTTNVINKAGIDVLATLLTLTASEANDLFSRLPMSGSPGDTLSPAQIAVLSHRLAAYLPSLSMIGSPHAPSEDLPGALTRLHPTLFRSADTTTALRTAGINDVATLRLLAKAEISAVLRDVTTCTEAQKVVLAHRVHLL